MGDAITVVSRSTDDERAMTIWKVLVLALVGLGANLLATYALTTYLATANSGFLFVVMGGGLVGLIILVLQALFVKSSFVLRVVVFVETMGPLVLFTEHLYPPLSLVLLAAAFLFFFFANMGSLRGLRQAAASMAVHFFEVARTVIPKALTGALIFITALTYLTYFSWGSMNDAVGRRFVNQVLSSANPVLQLYFSQASVDQNVGELLEAVVRAQLEDGENGLLGRLAPGSAEATSALRELPVPQRDAIIARVTETFRRSLEPIVGPLDPAEPVRDAIYRILENRFASLSPSQYATFSVGGLVLVFFALKGFFSLFHWLIAVVAYLVFKLLMAFGFARTGTATQTREFVMLS
jgi:hypothetical protein